MSRDRRGEPQQTTSGSSAAHAHAPIGKTTLTQALPSVPAPGRPKGDGAAAAAPGTVQRKAERHAADRPTSTPKQHAVHDIASLFGVPATAGGAPVQRAATSPIPASDTQSAPEIAARGVVSAGSSLPHLSQIQASFGHHDVSGVQAHQGPAAKDAARELGAEAYAIGNAVAFSRSPDLHTAAHEAAHVVQQRRGVQLKGGIDQPGDAYERHADAVADAVVAGRSAAPLLDQFAGPGDNYDVAAQRAPATVAATADTAAQPGVWEHTFGEASTPVGKLGRVQAPKGVYLRERPLPGAPSPSAPVPFNGLVFVERRTNQGTANERWCYVIATELGVAGFCEERYLAIDPPEPTATLHRTAPGERLATIAELVTASSGGTDVRDRRRRTRAGERTPGGTRRGRACAGAGTPRR